MIGGTVFLVGAADFIVVLDGLGGFVFWGAVHGVVGLAGGEGATHEHQTYYKKEGYENLCTLFHVGMFVLLYLYSIYYWGFCCKNLNSNILQSNDFF